MCNEQSVKAREVKKKLFLVLCVLEIPVELITHLLQQAFVFCQISGFQCPSLDQSLSKKNALNRVTYLREPIQNCFIYTVDMHVGETQAIKLYTRENSLFS